MVTITLTIGIAWIRISVSILYLVGCGVIFWMVHRFGGSLHMDLIAAGWLTTFLWVNQKIDGAFKDGTATTAEE